MNASFPSLRLGSFAALFALLLVVVSTGCGSLMQRTASLEDDELYLDRGEEFITDAEYLAYAYEQAGYDPRGEYGELDSRGGDAFQSSFGYVPQSLRGRSMLRGYMTPYGAAGFGPNPYDPWGSSFYGGYNPYSPYGGSMGYNMMGGNGWGMNPYMGNNWGMNPYAYNPYGYGYNGYNPYGFGGYGMGGYNNWGNSGWGSDVFEVSNVVVAPRTPIWSSTSINSNGGGGRLLTNKVEESSEAGEPAAPRTIWRGMDAQGTRTRSSSSAPSRTNTYGNTPSRTTPSSNSRSSWGSSGASNGSSTRSTTTRSSSSSRNSSWSGSSSGSSRSSGSSTRSSSSSGSSRGSSGSSTGRSSGSSRNSGRGGGQPLR